MSGRRTIIRTFAAMLVAGAVVTVLWFRGADGRDQVDAATAIQCLAVVGLLTVANLGIRWLRWHWLTRRLGAHVRTNDSIRIYFATLPAIATPFYVGELSRAVLLGKRYSNARHIAVFVWVVERFADAAILGLVLLGTLGQWWIFGIVAVACVVPFLFVGRFLSASTAKAFFRPLTVVWLAVTTTAAWLLPIFGLVFIISQVSGQTGTFPLAAQSFSAGSLLGGVTGIPLGIGVTGSTSIAVLANGGIVEATLPVTMLLFRTATVWLSLGIGIACAALFGRHLLQLVRHHEQEDEDHFDEIASQYAGELGDHVRDRLLDRKIDAMDSALRERGLGEGGRGLDIGCGQGWYATEMAAHGYVMSGCDLSAGQVEHAREYADAHGVELDLGVGSATELPYPDATFDFAYSINVFHHVGDAAAQQEAFAEVARVLKPGGVFFLQEMNVRNLFFRFYMGYVFPVIRDIDEGIESWIRPNALPEVPGARWNPDVHYFTFLPDFLPPSLMHRFEGLEQRLERSRMRHLSAHYVAALEKAADGDAEGTASPGQETAQRTPLR